MSMLIHKFDPMYLVTDHTVRSRYEIESTSMQPAGHLLLKILRAIRLLSKLMLESKKYLASSSGIYSISTLASLYPGTFHSHADLRSAFEFRDPVTKRLPAAKPSVLLNLQLTCSYFHDDVTQFLYDENEFYFSCPDSVEHFLLCLDGGPFNVNPVRHLGVVILDLRRCISFPDTGYAWPALPLKKMEDKHATPDWDGHLGRLPTKTTGHVLRRLEHFKGMKAQVGEKELERWTNAVTRMLENNTIGKLVIRGDPDWCSVLFSTSPLVKALLEFNGKGRINKVYKAGKWPRNAGDKVLQMLKDTLEGDVEEGSEAKHKKTMQSKKRKRASKAAEEPTQGLAISDDGE